ncbi:hypothetical protein F5B21DRAFT_260304 [Xylaria acuta]|nr:hypothetical protein F5B21DRAFT_260304 [Xylaria acuta]
MNMQSGANIVIRGKGSVKEGRGRDRARAHDRFEGGNYQNHEPLHRLITADTHGKIEKAKNLIGGIIETIVTTPEHTNGWKRQQLRDLAVANGTFRDDESRVASSSDGWKGRITVDIKCNICGGGGHIARGCSGRKVSDLRKNAPWRQKKQAGQVGDRHEIEYRQLLSEIGGITGFEWNPADLGSHGHE